MVDWSASKTNIIFEAYIYPSSSNVLPVLLQK